jgi:hypothetical protein
MCDDCNHSQGKDDRAAWGVTFDVGNEVLVITNPVGEEELVELFTPNHS